MLCKLCGGMTYLPLMSLILFWKKKTRTICPHSTLCLQIRRKIARYVQTVQLYQHFFIWKMKYRAVFEKRIMDILCHVDICRFWERIADILCHGHIVPDRHIMPPQASVYTLRPHRQEVNSRIAYLYRLLFLWEGERFGMLFATVNNGSYNYGWTYLILLISYWTGASLWYFCTRVMPSLYGTFFLPSCSIMNEVFNDISAPLWPRQKL